MLGDDPFAIHPWWVVPNVLVVATRKLGYPVALIVDVVASNRLLHLVNAPELGSVQRNN